MESLWGKDKFETNHFRPARDIIEEQFDYLKNMTGGKVIGKIKEYDGKYTDEYTGGNITMKVVPNPSNSLFDAPLEQTFNVQSVLGDSSKFVYEFYITSLATPKYVYRIGFIYYSIHLYPLEITLEKSLADELELTNPVLLEDEEKFKQCLSKILNSVRITSVIANLLKMNQ